MKITLRHKGNDVEGAYYIEKDENTLTAFVYDNAKGGLWDKEENLKLATAYYEKLKNAKPVTETILMEDEITNNQQQ